MKVYVVEDAKNVEAVYDEDTFKKEYKKYVETYWTKGLIWDDVSVCLWEVNGDSKYITPQYMEKLTSEEMSSLC
jgi:hypothetical protein